MVIAKGKAQSAERVFVCSGKLLYVKYWLPVPETLRHALCALRCAAKP